MNVRRAIPALGLGTALALVLAMGWTTYRSLHAQAQAARSVVHTHEVIGALQEIVGGVAKAESALRGFALSKDASFLEEFEPALQDATAAFAHAQQLTRDSRWRQRELVPIRARLTQRIALLRDRLRTLSTAAGVVPGVSPQAQQLSSEIRDAVERMKEDEQRLLDARDQETTRRTAWSIRVAVLGTATSVGLVLLAFALVKRLERRRLNDMSLLLQLGEMLQACDSSQEAHQVIAGIGPQLFPDQAGGIYSFNASRNLIEENATFGNPELLRGHAAVFEPEDCWAVRRGQLHTIEQVGRGVSCKHLGAVPPESSLCVPLLGHGEVSGILHLSSRAPIDAQCRGRAVIVSEQIGMALANLALRETLRNQSIRDPLTGLFNRRYLEETLDRELRRASRAREPVGVLMIDVDHFKRFNDAFGHEAGDVVLREIGSVLTQRTRGGDVACRLGGEELLVLLPGASVDACLAKADVLREAVAQLALRDQGRMLGQVTISTGVAAYPEHGATSQELLRAADDALYRAKHEGRNCVALADLAS